MNFIIAPVIVGTICATIYSLFELFARRRERIALIEKLSEIKSLGQIEGKIDFTFGKSFSCWALRGACLLIGLGLGLIVGYLITLGTGEGSDRIESVLYGGSILLFGGLGLLVAFILEMKFFQKHEK